MIELDKLKPSTAFVIISSIGAFFSIELMIFLLNRQLFLSLDIIRLMAVGIGLTVPFLIINGIIAKISSDDNEKKPDNSISDEDEEEDEKSTWGAACALTILFVSFISLLGFTFNFTLYKAIWILFWIELFFFLTGIFAMTTRIKRKK